MVGLGGLSIGLNRSVMIGWSSIPRSEDSERQKNQPKNKNQISANIITRFEQIPIYEQIPKTAKKQFQIFTKSKPQIPKYKQIPKQQKKKNPNQTHIFPNQNLSKSKKIWTKITATNFQIN